MARVERKELRAGAADAGRTVQSLLHDRLEVSHAEAKGLIAAGCVRRNGTPVARPDERARPGDRLSVAREPGRSYASVKSTARAGEGYQVLHEDDDLIVVEKEAGIVTVPAGAAAGDSLHELLLASFVQRGHKRPQLWVVHRIDRFTSGLVVFARTHQAYLALKAQFKARTPQRIYLAVAEGSIERDEGRLAHDLAEHPKSLKVHVVPRGGGGRSASLKYRVLERFTGATYVEVTLETGRRNQIRVQLAAEGHPLLGDVTYGTASPLLQRAALHAHRLAFQAPRGQKRLGFTSPLPSDMKRLIAGFRSRTGPAPRSK